MTLLSRIIAHLSIVIFFSKILPSLSVNIRDQALGEIGKTLRVSLLLFAYARGSQVSTMFPVNRLLGYSPIPNPP